MKLHFLGVGTASAVDLYQTCFVIENNNQFMLVDSGGGSEILRQLKKANISLLDINNVFLSHIHLDHCLGLLWVIRQRKLMQKQINISKPIKIYASASVIKEFINLMNILLKREVNDIGSGIIFEEITDKQSANLIGLDFEFLNTNALKTEMYGFVIHHNGSKVSFVGDETLKSSVFERVTNSNLLMLDAFCLDGDYPNEYLTRIQHATIKNTALLAKEVNAKNLLIFHTKDDYGNHRQAKFVEEAKKYFDGEVFVPNDLDVIDVDKLK